MTRTDTDRWTPLRRRGLVVVLTVILVAALRPHPTPAPLQRPLQAAAGHLQAGRSLAALRSLENALDFMPVLSEVRARAAEAALSAGRPERSLDHLEKLPPEAELSIDRDCLRAAAQLDILGPAGASEALAEAPDRCALRVERLAELTAAAFEQGDVQSARVLAQHWSRLDPASPAAALELAVATAVLDPSDAMVPTTRALDLADSPPPLASDLQLALEVGRAGRSPAYAFAQIGQALARAGRWHAARAALRSALDHDPDYVEARAYYGLVLSRTGGDPREELEKAYRQSGRAALPASFLGLHWLEAGQPARALPYLERAAAVSPENPAYAAQLGAAHAALGDLQTARALYERSVELAGDRREFYRLAAEFSLRNEIDPAGLAIPAARRAYALEPSAHSADLLGYAHLLTGQLASAERMLERALELDPGSMSVRYHLGLLRLEQGEREQAAALLESVVEMDAAGPVGELAQRTLDRIRP